MSLFNDNLKDITVLNLTIIILVSYILLYILGQFTDFINQKWIYVIVIVYFIVKLRNSGDFKNDLSNVFSIVDLKFVLLIVFANIFFSYGMLYAANYFVVMFPSLDFLVNFTVPSMSLISFAPLISTVVLSPISEELIFRGVLLNRLKIYVPTVFAVLITSLLFGSLHNFGSITSAIVFAICMAILYLKTENICVPILAHFLNNLFAEIIRIIDVNELLFSNGYVMLIIGIFAIVSAIILLSSIVKELKKLNNT